MRILSLKLKNLNSLKGEWHIDFTDPAYEDSGIFAITGQTGAGKTTILDAICLALYGETPRINTISGASNEVMTRQTGDCYAEVVILVDGKLYRCHWSQRRAYNKANGKLQSAEHELSELKSLDDDKGEIIESKLSRTKGKIQAITGMDFQQFTRSILLAQGSFSAFLKANASERADILEKITGTDIYADISKRVHEKKRSNEQRLKELTATLDGIELLTAEQIEEINSELHNQQEQEQSLKQTLTSLNEQVTWQISLAKLSDDIAEHKTDLAHAQQAVTEFAPQSTRLAFALKALEIESDYQQLTSIEGQLANQQSKHTQLSEQLPSEQDKLSTASEQLTQAQTAFNTAEQTLTEELPIIEQVKALDSELSHSQQRLGDTQTAHTSLQTAISERKHRLATIHDSIASDEQRLTDSLHHLSTNAHHANLGNDRDKLVSSCISVKELLGNHAHTHNALTKHQNNGKHSANQQQQLSENINTLTNSLTQTQSDIERLTGDMSQLLAGKPIADWRAEVGTLNDDLYQLASLSQQNEQLRQLVANKQTLQTTFAELQSQHGTLTSETCEQQNALAKLTQQLADKSETLSLHQQVIKLEAQIASLQDNEACPLCGATDHPYLSDIANGSHPHYDPNNSQTDKISALQQQIESLNQSLNQQQSQLQQSEQRLAINHSQQQDNEAQQAKLNEQIQPLIDTIHRHQADISAVKNLNDGIDDITDEVVTAHASQLLKATNHSKQALQTCQHNIRQYEQLEQQLNQSKATSEQLTTQKNEAQNQLTQLIAEDKLYEQQQAHLKQNIAQNFAQLSKQTTLLAEILSKHNASLPSALNALLNNDQVNSDCQNSDLINSDPLNHDLLNEEMAGLSKLDEGQIEPILDELRTIAKHWQTMETEFIAHTQQKIELEKSIASLQTEQTQLQHQQAKDEQEFALLTQTLNEQQTQYQQSVANRQTLFADKDPILTENSLRNALAEARERLDTAKHNEQTLQHQVTSLSKQLAEVTSQLEVITAQQAEQSRQFDGLLSKHGFADSTAFISARLPQDEREALQSEQTQLTAKVERLQALLDSKQTTLATETAKQLTTLPLEQLQSQLTEVEGKRTELGKLIGANQQKLTDNEAKQAKSSEQQLAIDKQRKDALVWEQLHKLIGSSDGQKFRNFAQGLTFDFMIRGANEQLQKMSDRYLLIRDDNEPLELNVIDNYQAGEIRSCKNLSGGESFIISLALALGLSSMASNNSTKNIQVDSLFLDEGFGTLDDDSLDIALDTLTSLQQEGKLIGVISHVQALKDRILTQIKVEKLSGGVSKISGAGVGRL